MEDISKKEWILGIAVLFLTVALAMWLRQPIENGMIGRIKRYEQSLKIENDSSMFIYARETNVGDVLAYGEFVSLQPQRVPELIIKYSVIEKRMEEYNMHTRQVCTTDGDGHTTCHTEIYYEWDYEGSQWYTTRNYQFLTHIFLDKEIGLPAPLPLKLDESSVNPEFFKMVSGSHLYPHGRGDYLGNQRYSYRILPEKFMGSIFVRFFEDKMSNPFNEKNRLELFYEGNIESVLKNKTSALVAFSIVYYIIFILLGIGLYFLLAYNMFDIE